MSEPIPALLRDGKLILPLGPKDTQCGVATVKGERVQDWSKKVKGEDDELDISTNL